MRNVLFTIIYTCSFLFVGAGAFAADQVQIDRVAGGFDVPWSLGFLPDGSSLVTERGGRLWHVQPDGTRKVIQGLPEIAAKGQGGLFDVLIPRDFEQTREILLSYAKPQVGGAGTAVLRAELSTDHQRLLGLRVLFEMAPGSSGGRHFGGRLVEGPQGHIFLTIGERGDRPAAQDQTRHEGSVIRLNRDGSVPRDNPFVGQSDIQPEIWSYGHRNPQGAALDAQGRLWVHEHGARGGDEVNQIRQGANYGWPVIAYGRHYSGFKIGEGTHKPGMEQPDFYWDPSIAPSGLVIYSGRLWPQWRGQFLVGSLKFGLIARLGGDPLRQIGEIKTSQTRRLRDLREAPDGAIWFLSETNGALYRMTPPDAE